MPPSTIRTKIVATVGPASGKPEVLQGLIDAGVDLFRFNMAHGDHDWMAKIMKSIRSRSKKAKRAVAVLADLQGPRIRVGDIPGGPRLLQQGNQVHLVGPEGSTTGGAIPVTYPRFIHDVNVGDAILLDDGQIELKVTAKTKEKVTAKVRYGGLLRPFKGINLPGSKVSAPSLTPKDVQDLNFVLKQKVDFIGLSFTRKAQDVIRLKERIKKGKSNARVVAKIESGEAMANLDSILAATDAVMVARGDLGVEMGAEEVPIIQKEIIRSAVENECPVITATQMLDSMTENPRPTRAEASDVANAILDGSDAIMLAGETARGKYPVQTVLTARRIAQRAERELLEGIEMPLGHVHSRGGRASVDEAAVFAACTAAIAVGAKLIVPFTETGRTARLVASMRVPIPVVSFTFHEDTYRRMALFWSARPAMIGIVKSLNAMFGAAEKYLKQHKLVKKGDKVILISGTGLVAGATNTMRVHEIS